MALFAWIRQHPAGNRSFLGLLVMDEAQAHTYGLGLIFATQAPPAYATEFRVAPGLTPCDLSICRTDDCGLQFTQFYCDGNYPMNSGLRTRPQGHPLR